MKVTIVSHMFPTPRDPTYGIFVLEQARALSNRGHQIRVISPVPYVPSRLANILDRTPSSELPKKDSYDDITVYYPRYWSLPRSETLPLVAYSFRRTLCKNRELFESSDIINAHVALPDGFGSIPVARQLDVPLITTVHGADLQQSIHNILNRYQIKITFDAAESVIVNSQKLRQIYSEYFDTDDKVTVIHNGIPIEKAHNAQSITRETESFRIIGVGNLKETKGFRYALEALASLDLDAEYIIIGDGPRKEALKEYASELHIHQRVSFIGEIPHEEVFSYLKSADLFVLPSYEEAFGVAYIEAMACGLPVVACEGEGPADFITHRETGFLVPPRDSEAIAQVIQELHDNPDLRQRVANRAQKTAINRFSWERNAESVERVFNEATENQRLINS